ncbi:uncharacterized protein KY384_002646 [Bacidia gigantensis]|uniref:uncharacterized protein n=1 Tax=Bacidia gigantensis TaxID=2732470 RepID=UPI001D054F9A|nr:uncharacterized protein KY384_002646 [Bacidia gigantensis]KAG8532768.1 hypothetical protein KY384_002646 [Bacidia gigantensis]
MSGMTITKLNNKRQVSAPKQIVAVPSSIPISPTVNFPTPATPIRYLFRTPITITAGSEGHAFPIHLEILLTASPFFAAAYNPTYAFRDSPTPLTNRSSISIGKNKTDFNKLSLPTILPQDFEYFIQWLYTRTLDHEDLTGPHPAYFKLIRLYSLADQLQVTALKNRIIDELATVADRTNSCPTPDDTRVVWDDESGCLSSSGSSTIVRWHSSKTGEGSENDQAAEGCGGHVGTHGGGGLRELIGDLFVWKKTDKLIAEHQDQWDEKFMREVIVKLKREKAKSERPPWRDRQAACKRYHVHDEWAPACEGTAKGS